MSTLRRRLIRLAYQHPEIRPTVLSLVAGRESPYQQMIRRVVGENGPDPRWIEGHMRAEHGTLDGLSPREFRDAVEVALEDAARLSAADNERLAKSYGL